MVFGTVVLDSGKFGEYYRSRLNEGTSVSLDRCSYKVTFEGKIREDCFPVVDPETGVPIPPFGMTCAFILEDVKRTDECQCSPMFCDNGANEEVSIHKGEPGGGFEFKVCKAFDSTEFCPPIPQINWCSGKKTTNVPYMRTPSLGFGPNYGTCTSKNHTTQAPLVNEWTTATGNCEKLLSEAINAILRDEATENGIPSMCPGPAYN